MFEYRVEFDPPTEVFNLKRRALRQCTLLQTTPYNFDGQTLYVPTVLSLQVSNISVKLVLLVHVSRQHIMHVYLLFTADPSS